MGCSPSRVGEIGSEVKESDITKLKAQLDESMNANSCEVAALKTQLQQLQAEHCTCSDSIAALNGRAEAAENAKKESEAALQELQQAKEHLQQEKEHLQQEKAALQQEKEALQHEKEGLQHELAEASSKGTHPVKRDCLKMARSRLIGTTGKYYCGQRMANEDDICGPKTGSNCKECQKLDIAARDLPHGFLVNGEGRIVRHGKDGVTWFCGAAVMDGVPNCDGYCGPTNGPHCRSCEEMQRLGLSRYQELIS